VARWTGDPGVEAVLEAAEAWRERCFLGSTSILTDHALWTLPNLNDLVTRYAAHPILGKRDFLDKLQEQMNAAPAATTQLAAEVMWFLHLFPSERTLGPATKRDQILKIWSWSGDVAPDSKFLDDAHLHGVGHPGTAYFTHRPSEFEYAIRIFIAFKTLPASEQGRLMQDDVPWEFMRWLDNQDGSDRRLARGAILYFLFPDHLERNLSKDHKRQIYTSFKGKLPADDVIKSRAPTLGEYDRAITQIRAALEQERGTDRLDFYDDETKPFWFTTLREGGVKDFTSWLNAFLVDHGLQLNQPGRDLKKLDEKRAVDPATGFWVNVTFVTSKPPRWLIHFDATGDDLIARVPDQHRAGVIGYANTKGGDSGALAVRILPVLKLGEGKFREIERWEWLLLLCFPGGLEPGSSGEAFDNFDTASGALTYLKRDQGYIFAALLCLNTPDEQLSVDVGGTPKAISYRDATKALRKLIHVAPAGGANE
jgi:5-methylcytosine-specific restriction protein B